MLFFDKKKKKEAVIIKVNIYLGLILHQFSKDFVLTHICASKQYQAPFHRKDNGGIDNQLVGVAQLVMSRSPLNFGSPAPDPKFFFIFNFFPDPNFLIIMLSYLLAIIRSNFVKAHNKQDVLFYLQFQTFNYEMSIFRT